MEKYQKQYWILVARYFSRCLKTPSKVELEGSARMVVCAWNAVVLDAWNKTDRFEKTLLLTLVDAPKEMQLIVKRLINAEKEKVFK